MQADLRLCWLHLPYCWKSHALAHDTLIVFLKEFFEKKDNLLCKVSVEDNKSMENYPACKELIQSTLDISNSKGLDKICRVISGSR